MKKGLFKVSIGPVLITLTFFIACNGQVTTSEENPTAGNPDTESGSRSDSQIAEYIRHIFQDKNGHLWFGTNGYGVAHYDGDSVSYFSNAQGFHGQQITGISEDPDKNIWFATDQGVVKYDWSGNPDGSKRFTNYSDQRYFWGQRFWSILADSKGHVWAGAASGVFHFDGADWTSFELPYPDEATEGFITKRTSWSITEDKAGNLWFSTNGFGAFRYDGQTFMQYSQKDGLTDNSVDVILEDRNGNMWFGTRNGGVSRYDGKTYFNFTENDSIGNNEICEIYEDSQGNIWFSSEGYGVYRYTPSSNSTQNGTLTNYSVKEGLGVKAVQAIFEDNHGRMWVGGGGGLYRFDGNSFINVTKNGPWN